MAGFDFKDSFKDNFKRYDKRRIVAENDKILRDLADYAATKGDMISPLKKAAGDIKAMEEAIWKLKDAAHAKFVEFKRLIKSGEMTYGELEDSVLEEFGITEPLVNVPKLKKPDESNIQDMLGQLVADCTKASKKNREQGPDSPLSGEGVTS